MNQINLVGRVSKINPQKEGAKYLKFSLAVRKPFKQIVGNDTSYFFDCTAFGKTADLILKYVKKGHMVGIAGRLQYQDWVSPQNVKKRFYSVIINELSLIGKTVRDETSSVQEKKDDFDEIFE